MTVEAEIKFSPAEVERVICRMAGSTTFVDFCTIIGNRADDYAERKYEILKRVGRDVEALGTFFALLLEDYGRRAAQ